MCEETRVQVFLLFSIPELMIWECLGVLFPLLVCASNLLKYKKKIYVKETLYKPSSVSFKSQSSNFHFSTHIFIFAVSAEVCNILTLANFVKLAKIL